jgi:uncharacterized protein
LELRGEMLESLMSESSLSGYRAALSGYIAVHAKPVEKYGHQPRLYALACQVGQGWDYDDDVVYAAAWLHDLGVFIGHRPEDPEELGQWDSVSYAVERSPGVLAELGFPADKVPAVLEAIRTHQPSAEPANIEGVILRDADILEQLGAIGILRTVCKVGRDTRFPTFTTAVESLRRNLDQLPDKLRLESAKALAEPKIIILREFLESVDKESRESLF